MKTPSLLLLALTLALGLHAKNAHAFGRKLDLNAIQGNYNLVVSQDTDPDCPLSITVAYDAKTASLVSGAFQFTNIDRDGQNESQDFDPNHAAYSDQWTVTSLHSDSVTQEQITATTTSDTSQLALADGPLDDPGPGADSISGLVSTQSGITTTLKYDEKRQTLTKSVDADGTDLDESCVYVRAP